MVKTYKLHKIAGLSAGLVLLILGITGFFIDHDKWSFLYSTTFKNLPQAAKEIDKKLFDAYWVDKDNNAHRIIGGKRGIFETFDNGETFSNMSKLQCMGIRSDKDGVFAATSDGIYKLDGSTWKSFALKSEYVTSISLSDEVIVGVVDKHELVRIDKHNGKTIGKSVVEIDDSKLKHSIKLSRFVRDLHYGRGLFEGDISLLINDYGAIILSFLALSGYIIWYFIKKKKPAKLSRTLIKFHSNSLAILSLIPLLILLVTGIFLDHSSGLSKFMKSVTIPHSILPPVYDSLKHDIWSVDYDGKTYRVGNRYGVYKSEDLKEWEFENKGLAFRMIRKEDSLYVSGMGAPNRIYKNQNWQMLRHTPHMFRDVIELSEGVEYFSTHKSKYKLPSFEDATLYALFMSLHDGTFFASWWVWVNDFASIALIVLGITGVMRWLATRKNRIKSTF
jgi:hypothetical protein